MNIKLQLMMSDHQAKALASLLLDSCVSITGQVETLNEAITKEVNPEKIKNISQYIEQAILQHSMAMTIHQHIEIKLAEADTPKIIIPGM